MLARPGLHNNSVEPAKRRLYAGSIHRSTSRHPPGEEESDDAKDYRGGGRGLSYRDTLIFLREYPVENVAMDGRIQSENPKILEAMKKISAGA